MSTDLPVSCLSVDNVGANRAMPRLGEKGVEKASVRSENKTGGRMSAPTPVGSSSESSFFVLYSRLLTIVVAC